MSDLRHSLVGGSLLGLSLIAIWPAFAATSSANLRITTITTQAEKHARAIELDSDDEDEDVYHGDNPNKMLAAAANPNLIKDMRIKLSPNVPFRVLIEGKHADAWSWQVKDDDILYIHPLSSLPYAETIKRSLLTIIIRY